ncbi:MAG: hypothetical protein PHS04_18640 [Tissierellia bacterium]|nr:hypothetical protein [Tissierellia bacterium]
MKIINHITEWENEKIGKFEESNLELIWIEATLTEGIYKYRYPNAERYQKAPVVAKGFIVYLLKVIEANPNVKSAKLYDSYYNFRFRQYKEIKESEPDAFSRDLASEFHNKHIEEEQKYAAYSKRLFDYLKEDDYTLIKRYCDSYFAYIKKYGVNTQEVNDNLPTENQNKKIDTEKLRSYFKATFKGFGNSYNFFDNHLIKDLQLQMSNREIATVALIIHKSDKTTKMPKSFESWYNEFCKIMGTDKKTYKPSGLDTEELKNRFYYL